MTEVSCLQTYILTWVAQYAWTKSTQAISGNFQLETNQLVLTVSPDLASSTPFKPGPKTGLLGAMTAVYRTCIGASGATGSVLQVVSWRQGIMVRSVGSW